MLALGLAIALLLVPIALGQSFWLRDVLRFTYPQKEFLRARLLAGHLPLWNPHLGLGRPFLGMVQPAVLYPGNLLLLLPVPLGLDLFMAAHLFVAGFGMRAWLLRLGSDEIEAATGGVLFALSGYVVSMLAGSGAYLFGIVWVPWILFAQALKSDTPRAMRAQAARLGLLFALCFSAGDPQAAYFAGFACAAQALAAGSRRAIGRALAILAGGAALAAVIALAQLLPGLEVASVGRPGGVPILDARHFSLHPARLLELAWPGAFGAPYSPDWFVHALVDEGTGQSYQPWAAGIYLGLATPWLALAQLTSKRRRNLDVALAALGLFALLLAFGEHAPAWRPFFRFVPGAHLFRYPAKYFFLTTLCLAALGARGIRAVAEAPLRAMKAGLVVLAIYALGLALVSARGPALMLALVGRLGAVAPSEAGRVVRERACYALAIGLAVWLPILLAARGRLSARRLELALAAVLMIDLFAAGVPLMGFTPSATYRARSPIAADLRALGFGAAGPDRLYRPHELTLGDGPEAPLARLTLQSNSGTDEGINQLDAYDVFKPPAEDALWAGLRDRPGRLLQITSTRFALLPNGQLAGAHPGLIVRRHYPTLGASIVEIEGAAPRVYLAQDARPVKSDAAALLALAAPDFVPGASATIAFGEARRAAGRCTLTHYLPESVALSCRCSAPAYAIVSDGIFPGWRATVGGKPAPILAANLAMRAVPIPAGLSAVELRYAPTHLRLGVCGTLAGLLFALVLLFVDWRARRRKAS
ncbi:MAG TPA: hypothetical protein VII38_03760 [Polyangia bacterium]